VVDELPQQEFLISWRQVESQAGLFHHLGGAASLFGKPLKGLVQRLAFGDERFEHHRSPQSTFTPRPVAMDNFEFYLIGEAMIEAVRWSALIGDQAVGPGGKLPKASYST
jgi:hypothetical protein